MWSIPFVHENVCTIMVFIGKAVEIIHEIMKEILSGKYFQTEALEIYFYVRNVDFFG